jgi:hypothetical protein
VHELEKLVDDCLEEAPMSTKETRILAYHIHDVGRHDGFVVFASLLLTQS